MTRRRSIRNATILILGLGALGPAAVAAGEASPRRALAYPRRELTARATAPHDSKRPLPRELRIDSAGGTASPGADAAPSRNARPAEDGTTRRASRQVEIDRLARAAALWSADRLVSTRGRREYFRVGFFEGMRDALEDPRLGDADYQEGERAGWLDPQARSTGRSTGQRAALAEATRQAEARVVEQFSDLAALPRYLPRADGPTFVPSAPIVAEPTLAEVFADFPLAELDDPRGRDAGFLDAWGYDAERLYRCTSYAEFFDAGWKDAETALASWSESRERAAAGAAPRDAEERRWFEERFGEVFAERMRTLFQTELLAAFELGRGRGWAYGARVHEELDFRRGFRVGYLDGFEDAARLGFRTSFDPAYLAAYRRSFDDWSSHAKPQLGEVRLADGNGDGVFEPGEAFEVAYEVINYGGGSGRLDLTLDGRALSGSVSRTIELPPRSALRPQEPLLAILAGDTPTRIDTEVELRLNDVVRSLALHVSRPLQLRRGAWSLRRDDLDGRVVLEIDVENESTRGVEGTVELTCAALPGARFDRALGTVDPGEVRRVSLEVTGLDTLELLAGRVSLDVRLYGGRTEDDTFAYYLPDAARDLANRELLLYMVRLAQAPAAPQDRLALTRQLVLTRMREDWKVAVMASGNPYKSDLRDDGAATALGDLLRTWRTLAPAAQSHAVFAGLSADLLALADALPGIHPFLRKSMRRLSRELP